MPRDLSQAHDALDKAVHDAYQAKALSADLERVSFIFNRYAEVAGLMAAQVAAATP